MQNSGTGREQADELIVRLRAIAAEAVRSQEGQDGFARPGEAIVLVQPALRVGVEATEATDDALEQLLTRLREKNFLKAQVRVGHGGIIGALVCACVQAGTGFHVSLGENEGSSFADALWGESPARALVACWSSAHLATSNFVDRTGQFTGEAIGRVTSGELRVRWMGETVVATEMRALLER